MCNLYSITTNQAAISALFRVVNRYVGNRAPMPGVFPDHKAPIVRNGAEGRELATARWGMPSSSKALMDATKKRAEKLQAHWELRTDVNHDFSGSGPAFDCGMRLLDRLERKMPWVEAGHDLARLYQPCGFAQDFAVM